MIELQYIFTELWTFAKNDYYMNKIVLKSSCRNYHNIFAKAMLLTSRVPMVEAAAIHNFYLKFTKLST